MQVIYGTGNIAKLDFMRSMLSGTGIEIIGIKEIISELPEVDETGNDPLENAFIKASAYYELLRRPVFSCDSGLYIDKLDKSRQPGVNVRTVNGKYLSDEEMISYYSGLAEQCGGRCTAQYKNAICLITGNRIIKYMGDDISGDRFIITTIPHKKRKEGFPLDSLSIDIQSGKYYYDLEETSAFGMTSGFRAFFKNALL